MSQLAPLFDTHAHLHDPWISTDLPDVLQRAREAAVTRIVTIGTDLPTTRDAIRLAEAHDNIWATVGLHPHDARDWNSALESEFRRLTRSKRVVAIGEIGLDFYRDLSPRDAQYRAFEAQLSLADELELPVVIHSRDAHKESYGVLFEWAGRIERRQPVGVIHCFSGDVDLALRYHELGFLISFAGPVTYPRNDALREVAAALPLSAFVVETDCPYLSPQPQRGKRNEPAHIRHTAERIAALRGESLGDFAVRTVRNALSLFQIDGSDDERAAGF